MYILVRDFEEGLGRLGHDGQHRFAIGSQGGVWVFMFWYLCYAIGSQGGAVWVMVLYLMFLNDVKVRLINIYYLTS